MYKTLTGDWVKQETLLKQKIDIAAADLKEKSTLYQKYMSF